MRIRLKNSVVVITGASGGIGRAAAEAFARKGATVVLAARREPALEEVARECRMLGSRALVVPTDVTDEGAVERLGVQAIEHFGRIDVWVNNAAISMFAPFGEEPSEAYRRVIDTNFFGCVHGARTALRYFREQGAGVLINVSSVVAGVPQPYTSAYVATKAAIRALSDCLRMELSLDEAPNIHVCTVLPASIDTPLFQHAANYMGRAAKALDPAYPAEHVADAIVRMAKCPRREAFVGNAGRMMYLQRHLAPALFEWYGARMMNRNHFQDKPSEPTEGNLFHPTEEHSSISGGWRSEGGHWSLVGMFALGLAAAAIPALLWYARQHGLTPRTVATGLYDRLQTLELPNGRDSSKLFRRPQRQFSKLFDQLSSRRSFSP